MNCDWQETDEKYANGFRRLKCRRSGCTLTANSPLPIDRIKSHCQGIPHAHEWQHWAAVFAKAYGITRAVAICRYIRWRFKGSPLNELPPDVPNPNLPPPTEGPGTELKKIFAELGISPTASCRCDAMANQMNVWGPNGCREHREEILTHLRTAYDESSIANKSRAALNAISQRLPMSIEGLLDLATERSRLATAAAPGR